MCTRDGLGYIYKMAYLMERTSDTLNFLGAIFFFFQKCQTFHIIFSQQTHSSVGISSFTDTACPWFSAVINLRLLLPKSTTLKHEFEKKEKGKKIA